MEQVIKSDTIYQGKLLNVRVDRVRLPSGRETVREVVEHPGAVVIVAVDGAGNVLLVKQYRYAVGRNTVEVPAGTLEHGETPDQAGPRELKEETGYTAGRWDPLASYYSSPGILTEQMHIYLARDLAEGTSEPEGDEDLQLEKLPLGEAVAMVERGEIVDGKTIIGLLLAREKLEMTTP